MSAPDPQIGNEKQEDLRDRTKRFALRIVRVFKALPKSDPERVIARQLLRSGTSVAANYRACHRARSKAEFIAKMGVVLEEADESLFWLEILVDGEMVRKEKLQDLMDETSQLVRIFAAAIRTARRNVKKK